MFSDSKPLSNISPAVPAANLPVFGSGTVGRLTKWGGFTSTNSAIGDSGIYEDKFGKVGIGTDSPTSKLTVAGVVEASGGLKFPDGTVQVTAGLTPNQTVLVRDLDNPARQAVHAKASCTINPTTSSCDAAIFDVPSGKRLVIEYASADLFGLSFGKVLSLTITTTLTGARSPIAFLRGSPGVPRPGGGLVSLGQQVRIYADAGTVVSVRGVRAEDTGTSSCNFSISGYLVDVP